MKTQIAVLVTVMTLFGCQGANEVTGPDPPASVALRPERTPERILAAPRTDPVVASRPHGAALLTTRPPPPTPRLYPCLVAPGNVQWKNEPCRPCDDVTDWLPA